MPAQLHRAQPTRSGALPRPPSHMSSLAPITHTSPTPQSRPRSWALGARACLCHLTLTHGQLRSIHLPFSLPAVLGAAGMVNPVLEMREQNFRVSVRTLSRRNQGRRHSASEALSLLGSGALAEGCLGPLPPPPPSPAPHSHWVMHKDPPAGACTPSGLPTHLLPQRHPGFTWGWLSLTFSHRPLHLPLGLTHFRTSQVPGALGVSFLHPVRP